MLAQWQNPAMLPSSCFNENASGTGPMFSNFPATSAPVYPMISSGNEFSSADPSMESYYKTLNASQNAAFQNPVNMGGDIASGTGITIRSRRQTPNPSSVGNFAPQGTAARRIRLQVSRPTADSTINEESKSCASEVHSGKITDEEVQSNASESNSVHSENEEVESAGSEVDSSQNIDEGVQSAEVKVCFCHSEDM